MRVFRHGQLREDVALFTTTPITIVLVGFVTEGVDVHGLSLPSTHGEAFKDIVVDVGTARAALAGRTVLEWRVSVIDGMGGVRG